MSNIAKTVFWWDVGVAERASCFRLAEVCERHPAISIIVLTVQRKAMSGALQLMLGSSPNVHAEISDRDNASAPQPNNEKPALNQSHLSTSDLSLTERQLDVLALMMWGKSNKAICRVLNLAESTVKNHITAILRALKVSNRTEAVVAVRELGWNLQTRAQTNLQSRISASGNSIVADRAIS